MLIMKCRPHLVDHRLGTRLFLTVLLRHSRHERRGVNFHRQNRRHRCLHLRGHYQRLLCMVIIVIIHVLIRALAVRWIYLTGIAGSVILYTPMCPHNLLSQSPSYTSSITSSQAAFHPAFSLRLQRTRPNQDCMANWGTPVPIMGSLVATLPQISVMLTVSNPIMLISLRSKLSKNFVLSLMNPCRGWMKSARVTAINATNAL